MIPFWQFVWIVIIGQMLIGAWLTFRLYPGKSASSNESETA